MKLHTITFTILVLFSCSAPQNEESVSAPNSVSLIVLGTIQDGGSPHIGCTKDCCKDLFKKSDQNRMVASLGLCDTRSGKTFLFDATPDIARQLKQLKFHAGSPNETPTSIFLTHAHIGHYSGLMYFGKEALNSNGLLVHTMPKMDTFLSANGPWDQLISNNNIKLKALKNKEKVSLGDSLTVMPLLVPHRDEYSETVGYIIQGPNKSLLYIPDIDKWEKWNQDILDLIHQIDYALVDGTFYDGVEVNHRDISEIPHPFVIESMDLFNNLSQADKEKVHFIHLNHTNPLLNHGSNKVNIIRERGFNIAHVFEQFEL